MRQEGELLSSCREVHVDVGGQGNPGGGAAGCVVGSHHGGQSFTSEEVVSSPDVCGYTTKGPQGVQSGNKKYAALVQPELAVFWTDYGIGTFRRGPLRVFNSKVKSR